MSRFINTELDLDSESVSELRENLLYICEDRFFL